MRSKCRAWMMALGGSASAIFALLPVAEAALVSPAASAATAGPAPIASPAAAASTTPPPPSPALIRRTPLAGASSGEHLWIVIPPTIEPPAGAPATWRVLHHHPGLPAGIRVSHDLDTRPEAMAAWDDRLWIVFPPIEPRGGREVWSVRAVRNAALETYFTEPAGRMSLLPSLPPGDALDGFAANADGPLAMLRSGGVRRLLRPSSDGWTEASELPAGLRDHSTTTGSQGSALIGAGSDGRTLLFALQSGDSMVTWRRPPGASTVDPAASSGAAWRESDHVPTRAGVKLLSLGRDGDLPLAVFADDSVVLLEYLRPGSSVALAEFAFPPAPVDLAEKAPASIAWTVLSLRDGPRLVEFDAERGPRIRRIDPQRGVVDEDLVIGALAHSRARWMHLPILGMLAGAALLGLLLFRSEAIAAAVAAPAGMIHAELGPRAVAAMIDYAPAALMVWIVMRGDPLDLVLLPIWSAPLERAIAPIAAILISVLCAAVSEGLFGASFGKRLLGLRVVRLDGSTPSLPLALLRGILKFAVLTMPLLGVIHLLNPSRRGLPELLTATAVVRRETTPKP